MADFMKGVGEASITGGLLDRLNTTFLSENTDEVSLGNLLFRVKS